MQGVPAASEGMVLPGLCVSSALRILSACLYLLSSCAACLLRAGLSDVSVLSALSLLPALLRSLLTSTPCGEVGWVGTCLIRRSPALHRAPLTQYWARLRDWGDAWPRRAA
jgi:hypothetical protein